MVRVMRDAFDGPELLAEVSVPADCTDVGAYLESTLGRQRSFQQLNRKNSVSDDYDNIVECGDYCNHGEDGEESAQSNDVGVAAIRGDISGKRPRTPNGGKSITQVKTGARSGETYIESGRIEPNRLT